jgi:hypothetical protein
MGCYSQPLGQMPWEDVPMGMRVNCPNLFDFHTELRSRAGLAPQQPQTPEQPSAFMGNSQPYAGILNSPSRAANIIGIADEFRIATNSGERLGQVSREPNNNLKRAHVARSLNSIILRNQKKEAYKVLGSSISERVQITMTLWYTAAARDPGLAGTKRGCESVKVRDFSNLTLWLTLF